MDIRSTVRPIPLEELPPASTFMQTHWWGRFKAAAGWTPHAFLHESGEGLLVLVRQVAPGILFAYVPHGPSSVFAGIPDQGKAVSLDTVSAYSTGLSLLAGALSDMLPSKTALIRFDPAWTLDSDLVGQASRHGLFDVRRGSLPRNGLRLSSSGSDIQPPDTVVLDLRPDEETLLSRMKSKWRYNVRLATKKGVRIRLSTNETMENDVRAFYALYRITAERDRIAIHPFEYYRRFLNLDPESEPHRELLCAEHEGEMIAAIMTARTSTRATYVFGAASDSKRNLMPAYGLQWEAITRAKAAGCREYDFFGIPPSDDPSHHMHGLYRFKTGFGGTHVTMPGTIDADLRPIRSAAYRSAETLRMWYYRRFRKKS